MTESTTTHGETGPGDEPVRILLVDDDEGWVESTAAVLEATREHFTVRTATRKPAALEALAKETPDCIVCDYNLANGTGLDLLELVREQSAERPFILITGQGSESVASEAIGQQVTDYIPKRALGGRDGFLAHRIESAVDAFWTRQALDRERRSKNAMLDILRASSSREGVVQEFCDHLVREHGYACAWIGTPGQSTGVIPQAAAGVEAYIDTAITTGTAAGGNSEPAVAALERREPQFRASLGTAEDTPEWEATATDHGFGSAGAVPITHDGATFGVLAVYKRTQGFQASESALLEEYAATVGYALRSTEWKESLLSASPVSVELELSDSAVPLVTVAEALPDDAELEILTAIPRDRTVLYVTQLSGVTEAVEAQLRDVDTIESVTLTDATSPLRCEISVPRPTPETLLVQAGGRVVDTTTEHGRVSITAVTQTDADIQSLVESVQATYPETSLQSVRSAAVDHGADDDPIASLTDKQRRTVEMAFYNGYFERPRDHNTTELAEKLGVSRHTITQHLRAAQRKLFSQFMGAAD